VRAALYDVLRFWLARGVDGFRIDTIHHLFKDEQCRDNPPNPDFIPGMSPHRRLLRLYTTDRPEVQEAIQRVGTFGDWPGPWNFQSPADTESRLRRLGYTDVWTWSFPVLVAPEDPREYFGTVMLGSHLERLEPRDRDAFVDAVLAELDEPVIEYVRLNILARRPS